MQESKIQAVYYINNIEKEKQLEENLWALTTITTDHEEIRKFVEKEVQRDKYTNNLLQLFRNIHKKYANQLKKVVLKVGSQELLVDLLLVLEENQKRVVYREFITKFNNKIPDDKTSYKALFNAIIEKESIDQNILPANSFHLPHLFLLYRNYKLISDKYLDEITDSWSSNNNSANDLNSILYQAGRLRVLYLKYDYGEISDFYGTFIDNNHFPNSSLKLKVYRYLDYSMYRLGYYDRSLNIVRNTTIPLSQYLKQKKQELQFTHLQGVYLYRIGKIQEAEKIYKKVLKETDKENPQISLSSLYNNLALTYHKLGNYNKYLDLQFQALEFAKSKNNYSHQLDILNNLFIYHRKSGDSEKALNYLEEAQEIATNKGEADDLSMVYTSLGSFYRTFKNNFVKAHEYLDRAKKNLTPETNLQYYIHVLNEKAEAYEAQHKYDQALHEHDQIIELTNNEKGPNYIDALVNKALINLKTNNIEEAEKLIEEYESYNLDQLDFPQIIKAKTTQAAYLQRTDYSQKALNMLNPVLNQVIARAQGSTDLKSGFWHVEDEYLDAFELAASIYMETGQPGKAVEKLDQLKTINDASLYQNPLVKSSLLDESELTEYKQLTDQLDHIRKKLLTAPEEDRFQIRQQISRLNTKKRSYDRKLTKNIDLDPISTRQVQNKLSAKELILHITELNDQFYIAKISRSNVEINTIDIDDTLEDLLTNSVRQIATDKTNLNSLYQIAKILDLNEIPNYVEKITLIPDSHFYQLPLDILPLEKPSTNYSYGEVTYAIERFKTQYLTTLEDFKAPKDTQKSPKQINYAGYGVSNFSGYNNQSLVPLPYAQSEVTSIANSLTNLSNIQTFTNEQSTKSTFKQTAPNSRIIHLATHSEVSERDPMFSTVYFSKNTADQDSTFDDQFFAYELFELNLDNDLVMLNSCESGSGPYIQGTGVMGLSRALRYAGAESLILNLWSVNDMLASDFAIYFYSQLNEGKSKAQALRATKQYFLDNKNADPHFWGPYMLIGNTNPIVEPHQDKNMAMAGIFLFYFLLMIGLSYLAQQNIIFNSRKKIE